MSKQSNTQFRSRTKEGQSFCLALQMEEACARLGMQLACVVPVRNYCDELELNLNCDILLLSAVTQMLRFTDNYFDNMGDLFNNLNINE